MNGDGMVSPIDVLILINRLNASGGGSLPVPPPVGIYPPMYWDVDGDDKLTPSDALAVINFINRLSPAGIAAPVGEGEADAASTIFARAVDEVLRNELPPFALLASEPPGHAPAARVAEPTAALNARSVDLEAEKVTDTIFGDGRKSRRLRPAGGAPGLAVRTGSGDGQELPSPLCQVSDDSILGLEFLVR